MVAMRAVDLSTAHILLDVKISLDLCAFDFFSLSSPAHLFTALFAFLLFVYCYIVFLITVINRTFMELTLLEQGSPCRAPPAR